MKLAKKFTLIGLVAIAAVAGLAYSAKDGVEKTRQLAQLNQVNVAIRKHMELDMMHDAINGDVFGAMSAVRSASARDLAVIKEDFAQHKANVDEGFAALEQATFPEDVAAALDEIKPMFAVYVQSAEQMLAFADEDIKNVTTRTEASASKFKAKFSELEEAMAGAGDKIEAWSGSVTKAGNDAADEADQLITYSAIFVAIVMVIGALIAYKSVFRSLRRVSSAADALSNEEYEQEVPLIDRSDEIGILAKALENLRVKAAAAFRLQQMVKDMPINIMTADPKNDFKINFVNNTAKETLRGLQKYLNIDVRDIESSSIDVFHKDPMRIRQMLLDPKNLPHRAKINLGDETLDLKVSAIYDKKGVYTGPMLTWTLVTQNVQLANDFEHSVGAVSGQLSASAGGLQNRATSLQSAIEELSFSALEISKRVHESLRIVREAVATGSQAESYTNQLANAAEKVGSVVSLISSIAEKTNLLALNATIESARAGEAGKGFAVVANEVKMLANQTSSSVAEITKQIAEMQGSAQATAQAIRQMCEVVDSVNKIATDIAGTVEEQQAATSEIARNISGGDGRADLAASSVIGMANQLNEVSAHLKQKCDEFLSKVRAM